MSQPIYKLFLARQTAAAYQLSPEERQALLTKADQALEAVGGTRVVFCDASWAAEQWPNWGIEQCPDMKALRKYTQLLNELNWFHYAESMTILGIESLLFVDFRGAVESKNGSLNEIKEDLQ